VDSFRRTYDSFCQSWGLWVLMLVAVLVFTASANYMSLKSYDDCHYAQKGVEMLRRGAVSTVTWADRVDFQYPPLQFWLLARSFWLYGKNDFAARLPSILMAIGILLMTYRLGSLTIGKSGALVAVAALMLTPLFVTNARRCQTDIPLAFWTTLAMLIYVEGLDRPKVHAWMAVPMAAGILTKSVLGLFPLVVVPAGLLVPAIRKTLRNVWLWLGLVLGVVLGASWSVHQFALYGNEFISFHYGTMVMSRTAGPLDLAGILTDYPAILLEHYQPIVLPALAGLVLYLVDRFRGRRDEGSRAVTAGRGRSSESDLLVVWAVLPVVLYSLSSLRHLRYLFPILPVYGILTGYLVSTRFRKWVTPLCGYAVPALTLVSACVYWFVPTLFAGDNNQVFKQEIAVAREHLAPGTMLPYSGEEYWAEANPLLYYWGVKLERPGDTTQEAVAKALRAKHRSMICVRERLDDVERMGIEHETMVTGKGWAWLRFPEATPPDTT